MCEQQMELSLGDEIGRGATAIVYKIDNKRVLKLYNVDSSINSIKNEYEKMKIAYNNNVPVPIIYEMIEYKGQYGYIMEYIQGETYKTRLENEVALVMSGVMSKQEFSDKFLNYIRSIAQCLYEVHRIKAVQMETMDDKLKWHTQMTEFLTNDEKEKIIRLIDLLPKGVSVCHGDPNPYNIIINNNSFRLIDWVNSGVGNPLYDIAEYVWLSRPSITGIPKDTPKLLVEVYNENQAAIVPTFLNEYKKLSGIDVSNFEMWVLPLLVMKLSSNRTLEEKNLLVVDIRARLEMLKDYKI